MALLCAILAGMSWRVRQRRVSLVLAGMSLLCSGLAAGIFLAGLFLVRALQLPGSR
jgi:hypothetical protein